MSNPSAADAAFAAMVAANSYATVIDVPVGAAESAPPAESEADAAFAYPNATVYRVSAPARARERSVEEEYERMVAANPGATVIRGPAGGGYFPPPADGGASTWTFSPDLSPERLAEIQAMVGASGGAPPSDADAERAAADAAFNAMVAAQPGAREVAPGVFQFDADADGRDDSPPSPTGELGE